MSKRKEDIMSEVPAMKKLSRGARKRRNKRLKWERIENGASCEPPAEAESPDIVFNSLKV